MNKFWILIFLGSEILPCTGSEILVFAPLPTKSHYVLLERLSTELASGGHQVTLIAPFELPSPVPNVREVVIENFYKAMAGIMTGTENNTKTMMNSKLSPWKLAFFLPQISEKLTEIVMSSATLQQFLSLDRKFDLLIAESILLDNIAAGLSQKFKCPTIIFSSLMPTNSISRLVGNPAPPSFVPNTMSGFTNEMPFYQRFANTILTLLEDAIFEWLYLPSQDKLMRKYFGDYLPPIRDVLLNTSFLLVNHYHSLAFPRPLLPNVVEIGGFHVKPPKPLPQELKRYMDESRNGVVLFSMGSHMKSSEMRPDQIDGILRAFAKLDENVLWKYEDDNLGNIPENVKIMKWVPQSDVLVHPNLKLFVTHGGMLSTTEAIYRGVPIVGVPVMGDQLSNMMYASQLGYGVTVPLDELNEASLYSAIQQVLNEPKFSENARRGSKLLTDRPVPPLQLAVYWVEYVIRHGGAPHLRSPVQNLKWCQAHSVDILGFILLIVYFAFRLVIWFGHTLLTLVFGIATGSQASQISKSKME